MNAGGIVAIMAGPGFKQGVEVRPKWLIKALNGGTWSMNFKGGRIVPSDDFTTTVLKKFEIDRIEIGKGENEEKHSVRIDSKDNKPYTADMKERKWKKYYEFEAKTEKGGQHNVTVFSPSSASYKSLRLEIKKAAVFIKISPSSITVKGKTAEVSFLIPVQYTSDKKAVFRITPAKAGLTVTASGISVSKLKVTGESPLAELLGFKEDRVVGNCGNTLNYNNMCAPLRVLGEPNKAALIMKDCGSGIFVRTQLDFSQVKVVLKSLLNDQTKVKISKYLKAKKY
jgi:hypothetical protein